MPPSIANLLELSTASSPRNTPVQAYAKLDFGLCAFYVQSLSVTLGRKAGENDHVDVHLGDFKGISRQHARVQYSFARNCFEIVVFGRNGLFVDNEFHGKGEVISLEDRSRVQIGQVGFDFLLPYQGALPQELDPHTKIEDEEDEEIDDRATPQTSITPTPPPPQQPENNEPPPEKPDIPYATLIAQSLLSHPKRRRTLQEIYAWIQDHHAYFKKQNKSWQSSIRHNLATSPAFVEIGPRPNTSEPNDKKSKRANVEWGISPEYEGLIGNLTAREGDTDKLSTKLNKKKATPAQQPPKPAKPTPQPKKEASPTTSPAPSATPSGPTQTEDKSKLEELVKNMETKGLNMASLLQEALAQMNKRNLKPPTPAPPTPSVTTPTPSSAAVLPAKRPKVGPSSQPPQTNGVSSQSQSASLPINMPMPLPYTPAKAAPIPSPMVNAIAQAMAALKSPTGLAAANVPVPTVKSEGGAATIAASVPSPALVPVKKEPETTASPAKLNSPLLQSAPVPAPIPPSTSATQVPAPQSQSTVQETAASRRAPRGKKRSLEE